MKNQKKDLEGFVDICNETDLLNIVGGDVEAKREERRSCSSSGSSGISYNPSPVSGGGSK